MFKAPTPPSPDSLRPWVLTTPQTLRKCPPPGSLTAPSHTDYLDPLQPSTYPSGPRFTTGFNLCAELRAKYFEKAQNELGVTVTEVDIAPYQEKCTDLINSIANRSDMTKQVYDAIQAAK